MTVPPDFEEKLRQWGVNFVCRADPKLCERVREGFYYYNQTLSWPIQNADIEVVVDRRLRNRAETRVQNLNGGRFQIVIAFPPNLVDQTLAYHEAAHPMQDVAAWLYFGKRPADLPSGLVEALAEAARKWLANKTGLLPASYADWEKRKELAEHLLENPDMPPEAAYGHWHAFYIPYGGGDLRDLIKASVDVGEYKRYYGREYGEKDTATPQPTTPQPTPPTPQPQTPSLQSANSTQPQNATSQKAPQSSTTSNTTSKPAGPARVEPEPYKPTSRDEEYWWLPQYMRPQIVQASGGGLPKALRAEVQIEGLVPWYVKVGDKEVFLGYAPKREGPWSLGFEFEVEVPAKTTIYAPGGGVATAEKFKLSFERQCEGDKCYLVPKGAMAVASNYSKSVDVKASNGAVEVVDWPLQAGQGGPRAVAKVDAETLAKAAAEAAKRHPEFGVGMYNFPDVEQVGKLVVESPGGTAVVQPVLLGGKILVGQHVSPAVNNPVEVRGAGRVELPIYAKGLTFEDIQKLVQEGKLPGQQDVVENGVVLQRRGDKLYIYYKPEGSPIGVNVAITPTWKVGNKTVARETAYVGEVKFPGVGETFPSTAPWPPPEKTYDLSLIQKYATESGKFVTVLRGVKYIDGSVRDEYILWEVRGDKAVPRYQCGPNGCREVSAVVWPSISYPVEVWHRGNVVWRGTTYDFDLAVRSGGLDLRHGQGEPIPGLGTPTAKTPTQTPPATPQVNATATPPRANVTVSPPRTAATRPQNATAAQNVSPRNVTMPQTQINATTAVAKPQAAPQLDLGKAAEEMRKRLAGAPQWLAQGFSDFFRIQAENWPKFFQQTGQFLYAVGSDIAAKAAEAAKSAAVWLASNLAASTAARAQTVEERKEAQPQPTRPPDYVLAAQVAQSREERRAAEATRYETSRQETQRDESERYVRKLMAESRSERQREEVKPATVPREEERKQPTVARVARGRVALLPL